MVAFSANSMSSFVVRGCFFDDQLIIGVDFFAALSEFWESCRVILKYFV